MLGKNRSALLPSHILVGAGLGLSALLVSFGLAACDPGSTTQNNATPVARSGEVVFQRYCNVCHPGGGAGAGPSLILALPQLSDEQVRDYVRHGKTRMPGFTQQEISDPELNDLVAYIRTLK